MRRHFWTAVLLIVCMAAFLMPTDAQALEIALAPSALYAETAFCQRLSQVELTGDYRADLVNVALSQVGYHEGDSLEDYAGGNALGAGNYIEYSSAFFGLNAEWCAMFVSWCARQAKIPYYVINTAARASTDGWGGSGEYCFHLYSRRAAEYAPVPGDIVFFTYDGYSSAHVGIVAAATECGIYTVEGNSNNAVRVNYYDYDAPVLLRYGIYVFDEAPALAPDSFRVTKVNFAADTSERHGSQPDGSGGYLFRSLYPMAGRPFQMPTEAFAREGCTLRGYYVRRADGLWLTGDGTWERAEVLQCGAAQPYLVADGAAWDWDGLWAAEDTLEFHCVWENAQGAAVPDETAWEVRPADGEGWQNPYYDLLENDWYYAYVRSASRSGLVPYTFSFDAWRSALRADYVVMLYRLFGSPAMEGASVFADLAPGSETEAAAAWARDRGIAKGVSDTAFGPGWALSREQAVTMLYRLFGAAEAPEQAAAEVPEFADAADVSDWAAEAVTWAVEREILRGVADADARLFLMPQQAMTRAEAVTLVCRVEQMLPQLPAEEQAPEDSPEDEAEIAAETVDIGERS